MKDLLRCDQLAVGYRGRALFPAFDLTVREGEFVVVVGRNGAGKSTWLRTVLGLQAPVSGRVAWREPRPRVAYVPQAASLDSVLPVRARTIASWGRLFGWSFLRPGPGHHDRQVRDEALAEVGAEEFAGRPFRDLSGGQRQRVLFARMRASEAEVALLDEPTASMDTAGESEAYALLARLAHERRVAIIVVTHTLAFAARYADTVVFFDSGEGPDGGVVEIGAPDAVFAHPVFQRHFGEVSHHG
jgi:zinc transport system ATP-binding protein